MLKNNNNNNKTIKNKKKIKTKNLFLVVQKHFLVHLACVLNDILKQEKVQGCWFVDEKALD